MEKASNWSEWFDESEFCATGEGVLGRRFTFSNTGIVGFSERLEGDGSDAAWRLTDDLLDHHASPAIDREAAIAVAPDPTLLDRPSCLDRYPDQFRPAASPMMLSERVEWLDQAVRSTLHLIGETASDSRGELLWNAPGSWDYDYAIDQATWIRSAFSTIGAMVQERELIIFRHEMRRDTEYPD